LKHVINLFIVIILSVGWAIFYNYIPGNFNLKTLFLSLLELMEMWVLFIALLTAAYLLGSIPFGLLISQKVAKLDITKAGSGNIGAANVAREVGLKWGIATFLADTLKGFIPVICAYYLLGSSAEINEALKGMIGLAALLGHQFSIYNRFKGGKGVATYLGVFLAISPISCLLCGMIFVLFVWVWRYISLGSIVASLTMPLCLYFMGHPNVIIIISLILSFLVTFKHRENIRRLVRGNERRWQKSTLQ
jgi:glycerol-3-phosphate acyltransferase PlsY